MPRARRGLLLGLLAASGACDLLCEIAWSRSLGLVFGVTVFAQSAVLAVFMAGMAAGGFGAGRLLRSRPDAKVLFAQVHVGLAAAIAGSLPLFSMVRWIAVGAAHSLPVSAFEPTGWLLSALVLLAPTFLMGTTLPVDSALLDAAGRDVGALYAAGTLGGVLGAWGAAFALLPAVGTRGTLGIAALADGVIALATIVAAVPGGDRAADA